MQTGPDPVMLTEMTGFGVIVAVIEALTPSLVAVMTAAPTAIPVTSPVAETVATVLSHDDHVTTRPVSVAPCASFVVAVSCDVTPIAIDTEGGVIVTVATGIGGGALTVTVADPV